MSIGSLFFVKADDHLYNRQGLLLVEQDGFVITEYMKIRAIYHDGISNQQQQGKICNEDNFDLTPIRNKFYQLAASELTRNGFEYQVDKTEFAEFQSNRTIDPHLRQLLNNNSKRGELLSMSENFRGDQAVSKASINEYPSSVCQCFVTKCSCDHVRPKHQIQIKLPFHISGDIYIRLDLTQTFPEATNKQIEQFDGMAMGIVETEKGQFDSYVKSQEKFEIVEMNIDNNYIHTIMETEDMTEFIYVFALDDHFCDKNDCRQDATMNLEVTWTIINDNSLNRSKRTFFGLETDSETNAKIRTAMKITNGLFDQNQNSILNLDQMIKQTDKTVEEQTETLNDLYQQLCQLGSQTRIQSDMLKIERSIINNVHLMIQILQDCSMGVIPNALSFEKIKKLCETNLSIEICDTLNHRMKNIMRCEINAIHLLSTKYLLDMRVHIPVSFKAQYKLFNPITIPVFDGQYHHEIGNLKGKTILKYNDKPEIVILTDCNNEQDILICQASQSPDQKSHACVTDIMNNKSTKCWTNTYKNTDTCFVKKFKNGLLVSTKFPLQVHQHSLGHTFNSKSKIINGTSVIKNDPENSYSVACSGILVSTDMSDPRIVQIHNNHDFDWDDAVQPLTDKKLAEDLEITKHLTKYNLADLNIKVNRAHGDIDYNEVFNLKGVHAPTWMIVGTIIAGFFALFLLVSLLVCICRCYRSFKRPIVELAGYMNPNSRSDSFKFRDDIKMRTRPNERLI